MFDAWTAVGVGGGALALNYLAAGRKVGGGDQVSFRLSLDRGNSLFGDVRVLGGLLSAAASMYTHGSTKRALQVIAGASLISVLTTEALRFQMARSGARVAGSLPVFPSVPSFGNAGTRSYAAGGKGGWAS